MIPEINHDPTMVSESGSTKFSCIKNLHDQGVQMMFHWDEATTVQVNMNEK